ncbi:MAG: ABC transporter permease [bacterium]|nr:ABC transporter permease [bacterium]
MSRKVFAVIKREFITRVRTKGFIIGTLIMPMIFVFFIAGVFIFAKWFQPSTKRYYVIDRTEQIFAELANSLSDTLSTGEPKYIFTEKSVPEDQEEAAIEEYGKLVLSKEIDGYLIIPENLIERRRVTYSARNVSNLEEQDDIEDVLSRIVTNIRLLSKGFSPEDVRNEFARVSLVSRQVTEEGEISKHGGASFALTYLLSYIMLLMMMIYGSMVMRSVIEEKSQRITETIVSTIKPIELMMGKIVGISSVGLVQLVFMAGIIFFITTNGEGMFIKFGVTIPDLLELIRQLNFSASMFIFFILFFLMGFVFYSSMFAAIGAMVNTEDEGQQFVGPMMILIMIGYFIMIAVIQNPDTPIAFWASLIPFFTPLVSFARIAVSDPIIPSGAYLSVVTQLVSTFLMIMFVSKIYRVGILMYGKKPSIKEAIKWIRYS